MKPDFSIISVCRNEVQSISKTCESVINQTHRSYEWIVVDGASTDGTIDILKKHQDHIAHFITEPDDGIYHAMNKGIMIAKGDYLVFMNGGDSFPSSQILEWVSACPKADLIYGDAYHNSSANPVVYFPDVLPPNYLLWNQLAHQATYYRRGLFNAHGIYDTRYKIAADYDLNVRLLEIARASHHHIAKPLATFDMTGISNSRQHRRLRKLENHLVRMRYFPQYRWSPKAWRQMARNLIGG